MLQKSAAKLDVYLQVLRLTCMSLRHSFKEGLRRIRGILLVKKLTIRSSSLEFQQKVLWMVPYSQRSFLTTIFDHKITQIQKLSHVQDMPIFLPGQNGETPINKREEDIFLLASQLLFALREA